MTRDELLKSAERFFVDAGRVLDHRNRKYAKPEDAFANFERSARIAHADVTDVFMIQIGEKIARIQNWLDGVGEGDEPLRDSFIDAVNFLLLLNAYLEKPVEPLKDEPVPVEEKKPSAWDQFQALFAPSK